MHFVAKVLAIVGNVTVAAIAAPLVFIALLVQSISKLFDWAELHGVYNGDKVRQDLAKYRIF